MDTPSKHGIAHPFTRRLALQAGGISLLGLGSSHLNALRAEGSGNEPARSVIFIFLSGGLGQHDSFDMKPDAPEEIRGEFKPIACRTPGISICEHLPKLAERSEHWSLVRSLTHSTNDHSAGHMLMLSGRNQLPPGFNSSVPKDTDWPSIASVVSAVTKPRHNLPPAVVLPERLIHFSGRVIPGQFGGLMGRTRDPWFLEASHYEPRAYGAFPQYEFDHQRRDYKPKRENFDIPDLNLPQGVNADRFHSRLDILKQIDQQVRTLDSGADKAGLDRFRQAAVSLLSSANVRKAFDIRHQPMKEIERYGNHSFGWSLLMAARLVEAGVNMVQVNLGNNETWDTHGNAFPHLKEKLFPPTDQAVSALLDDLQARGLLESTLIVMAGEFGRTPKVSHLTQHYKLPGRDHWGAAQTVFFAGGGTGGGKVIGATDRKGAYPISEPQTPENFAATIYHALGIPSATMWNDAEARPHHVYYGEPIRGLIG